MTAAVPAQVTTLFWDVGGVILSNGWDQAARDRAARQFSLDREEFEKRHAAAFGDFETGRISLPEYLDRAIFYRPQPFSKEQFISFMLAQSSEISGTRALLDELTAARRYLLAALNNEGRELNVYRIEKFDLRRNFPVFFSSCYLGLRKPDEAMYRKALELVQRPAAECVFIDDRMANLDGARRLGMRAIQFQTPAQLRAELAHHGVGRVTA